MSLGFLQDIPTIGPEPVFYIGSFPVVNSFLMILLIGVLILIAGYFVIRKFSIVPSKFQVAIEIAYESMFEFIEQITEDKYHTKKIFPLIGALFVYIGLANFLGLIPGLGEITYRGTPMFRTATADFNTTLGLSLGAIVLIQIVSIRDWGIFAYLGRYFQFAKVYSGFKKSLSDGFMAIIDFCIGLLDIVSEVAKVVSLSIRLFGNMYAGQVLMVILVGVVAIVLPSMWLAMSLLSAIIQTIVFGALIASYYMLAIKPDEEDNQEIQEIN